MRTCFQKMGSLTTKVAIRTTKQQWNNKTKVLPVGVGPKTKTVVENIRIAFPLMVKMAVLPVVAEISSEQVQCRVATELSNAEIAKCLFSRHEVSRNGLQK